MSFSLIKQAQTQLNIELTEEQLFFAECYFDLENMIQENVLLQENIKQFVVWSKNLLDRPIVNKSQIEHDPTVNAGEALPFNVKDEKDAFAKLAKTLAGLTYFMNQNVSGTEKATLTNVQSDKQVDDYVKSFGVKKANDIITKINSDLQTKDKSYVKELLTKIENYYRISKA